MNPLPSFPETLLTLAWVSTGAVGPAWLVTLLLRRKSAALRHLLWLFALSAPLLALPMGWMHARLALPILPRSLEQVSTHGLASESEAGLQPSLFTPADRTSETSTPASSTTSAPQHEFAPPFNPWFVVWFLGVAGIIIRILYAQRQVKRLIREDCSPGPEGLVLRLNETKLHFKFTRPVRLMVTPLTEVPFCHGTFLPVVIFPESWREWDDERIEVCLTHELAHIVRGDLPAMALAQAACILCWFNPLVWFASARLRDEAEKAADDLVLTRNIRPETYAANLVAITEKYRVSALSPTIALSMARPNRLKARVEAILDSTLRRKSPGWAMILTVSLLAMAGLTTVMVVRLTAAVPKDTDEKRDLVHLDSDQHLAIWNTVFVAIHAGDLKTVESFLTRGLDVNFDRSESSMLYLAVTSNQLKIVKFLLSKGADVNQKTSGGDTPILRACWRGNREIADALIKAGAKPNDILYATGMGNLEALKALGQKQPLPPQEARNALDFALASGRQNTFDWLWTKLAPMNADQKDKLLADLYETAATWGQPGMFPRLDELGASAKRDGTEALLMAVIWDQPEAVRYLLEKGVSANNPSQSLLRSAADTGNLKIARLLLDHGVDLNARDGQGLTPLAWAAYLGKEDFCELLIERGADGSIADNLGQNAAWHAAGGIHCPGALEAMIKKGVTVTGKDKNGRTILNTMLQFMPPRPGHTGFPGKIYSDAEMKAYDVRERRTVDLLVAAGADINSYEPFQTPLLNALSGGHHEAARALIDDGADLNFKDEKGNTTLGHISSWAWLLPLPTDILETMLKRGCDPNTIFHPDIPGADAAKMAIPVVEETMTTAAGSTSNLDFISEREASYREAVKLLLRYGAVFSQVADSKEQALLQAAARGDLAGMQDAVRQGASINAADGGGWNALTISLALGYQDEVDWLLGQGVDPTTPTRQGYSPLFFAAKRQNAKLVEDFIAKGAKPDSGAHSGLDEAIVNKNQRIFDDLIKAGADAKSVPIFPCISQGQVAMAKTLLDAGADPDPAHPIENRNTVYWAVYYDQPEILKLLLAHGANPSLKDAYGETPLSSAQKFHKNMVPLLEEAIKRAPVPK